MSWDIWNDKGKSESEDATNLTLDQARKYLSLTKPDENYYAMDYDTGECIESANGEILK